MIWNSKLQLWHKVLIGMLLGSIIGHFVEHDSFLIAQILSPIQTIFTNSLKMVVVPLIFFSVLYGVTSIDDTDTFGRLGSRALMIYCITTIIAVSTGLLFANIFKPGVNISAPHTGEIIQHYTSDKSISEILVSIVPNNPVAAMVNGNTMQVVVFAFFTGFALILIGEKGRLLRNYIVASANLVFKMVELVIKMTPYGVFSIMAETVSSYGTGVLIDLMKFALVVLAALTTHYCFLGLLLLVIGRLNPISFYTKMAVTQALAFATSSTKATLPTAMVELRKKLGVSKQSSSFILPLGASMNMDATAIYLGICTVFFAQRIGVQLNFSQYIVVILTATIGSIGAAGFPGGGVLMLSMVLSSVGLPLEGISLILGVDRVLEMVRTSLNITGDCAVTVIVDRMENTLNKKVYDAPIRQLENNTTK